MLSKKRKNYEQWTKSTGCNVVEQIIAGHDAATKEPMRVGSQEHQKPANKIKQLTKVVQGTSCEDRKAKAIKAIEMLAELPQQIPITDRDAKKIIQSVYAKDSDMKK